MLNAWTLYSENFPIACNVKSFIRFFFVIFRAIKMETDLIKLKYKTPDYLCIAHIILYCIFEIFSNKLFTVYVCVVFLFCFFVIIICGNRIKDILFAHHCDNVISPVSIRRSFIYLIVTHNLILFADSFFLSSLQVFYNFYY